MSLSSFRAFDAAPLFLHFVAQKETSLTWLASVLDGITAEQRRELEAGIVVTSVASGRWHREHVSIPSAADLGDGQFAATAKASTYDEGSPHRRLLVALAEHSWGRA